MTNTAKTGGWNKVDARIWVLSARVKATSVYGERFELTAAFRIDGREVRAGSRGNLRVDIKAGGFGPWEAIDGGQGVKTLAAAKALVAAWRAANAEQHTISPRIPQAA